MAITKEEHNKTLMFWWNNLSESYKTLYKNKYNIIIENLSIEDIDYLYFNILKDIKCLVLYKDWLFLNHLEYKPRISDKIYVSRIIEHIWFPPISHVIGEDDIENDSEIWINGELADIDYCYVEISLL